MAAAPTPTPAIMEEVLATDLVVGQEYYYHRMHKVPPDTVSSVFQTDSKDIVRFNRFVEYNTIGDFTIVQHISGEESLNANIWIHLNLLTREPSRHSNFRFRLYRKTDTPKNQEMRDKLQQREALAQMYDTGYSYYEDDGTLVKKPGLPIDQYVSDDGVLHLGHAPPREGERARPTDPTYLPGGKRKYRRTRKSKKSRKGKSRKNRRKSNRRRR